MSESGKVALVTGSTSGIGLAVAHALAKRGVNVIITGFGDESVINGIVNDIKARNSVQVHYVAGDLGTLSGIESLWSSVTQIYPNGVDILVNNAGVDYQAGPVEGLPDEKWDKSIALMLTAPFQLIKRCVPAMKKKGYGRIVNISSVLGIVAMRNNASYISAKHGLIGLTKSVALETAAHGITCNAVCPGATDTPLLERNLKNAAARTGTPYDEIHKKVAATSMTGKMNTPEQIAEIVEFLSLSGASSQMTGASYMIDHGETAK